MFQQFFLWLLVSGVWWVIVFFSQQITSAFGRLAWAEANLWSTRNMYILGGFVLIIVGFLFIFGVIPVVSPVDTATWM